MSSVYGIRARIGRTCPGILVNFTEIAECAIIISPDMPGLQFNYLSLVLVQVIYKKFRSFDPFEKRSFGLVNQIGVQEMQFVVIDTFYGNLIEVVLNVLIKNTLGK